MDGKFLPDHVREEWFELYVMGTLPEEQMAILEARLLVDEDCRLKLDQTEAYVQAMRVALRRAQAELGAPAKSRWHWRALLARPWPMAASPAVVGFVGAGTLADAIGYTKSMTEITVGPTLDSELLHLAIPLAAADAQHRHRHGG